MLVLVCPEGVLVAVIGGWRMVCVLVCVVGTLQLWMRWDMMGRDEEEGVGRGFHFLCFGDTKSYRLADSSF